MLPPPGCVLSSAFSNFSSDIFFSYLFRARELGIDVLAQGVLSILFMHRLACVHYVSARVSRAPVWIYVRFCACFIPSAVQYSYPYSSGILRLLLISSMSIQKGGHFLCSVRLSPQGDSPPLASSPEILACIPYQGCYPD